jgi:hypothetical protein
VTVTRRSKSQIRREANLYAARAIRNYLADGSTWHDDWSHEDNVKLSERLGEIADVLETR